MNLFQEYPVDFSKAVSETTSKVSRKTTESAHKYVSKPNAAESLPTISLFCGGGGLDLGLEAAGFNIRFSTDIDPYSAITHQIGKSEAAKRGKKILQDTVMHRESICDLNDRFILSSSRVEKGEISLLAGGPPCQAFSIFGKRKGRSDQRGQMVYEYLRLLAQLSPENFVFENVFGLLSIEGGALYAEICKQLAEPKKGLKYTLSTLRLNAADYGVPQFRDRIFIVGSRRGKTIPSIPHITGKSPGLFPYRTVADALHGLPKLGTKGFSNHTGRNHSDGIISRYRGMSAGDRDSATRINKLDLTSPSFTIIVGSDAGGGKGHIHPTEPREVSPRESARIQTFPDWWVFAGRGRHPIRQIGNAVPPVLGGIVGNAIRENILGIPPISLRDILGTLDQLHLFRNELNKI